MVEELPVYIIHFNHGWHMKTEVHGPRNRNVYMLDMDSCMHTDTAIESQTFWRYMRIGNGQISCEFNTFWFREFNTFWFLLEFFDISIHVMYIRMYICMHT